jgi:dTDP-4-amino-4,6-dideoxygalactose transaminase
LYVVRVEQRDELQKYLTQENIGTGLHYPIPIHLQKAYAHLGYTAGSFPVAEKIAGEILSLPMYPQLRNEQQEHVINVLNEFYEPNSKVEEIIRVRQGGVHPMRA